MAASDAAATSAALLVLQFFLLLLLLLLLVCVITQEQGNKLLVVSQVPTSIKLKHVLIKSAFVYDRLVSSGEKGYKIPPSAAM